VFSADLDPDRKVAVDFRGDLRCGACGTRFPVRPAPDNFVDGYLPRSKGTQTAPAIIPLPYRRTELCPARALTT
jgi:hypothetical protein